MRNLSPSVVARPVLGIVLRCVSEGGQVDRLGVFRQRAGSPVGQVCDVSVQQARSQGRSWSHGASWRLPEHVAARFARAAAAPLSPQTTASVRHAISASRFLARVNASAISCSRSIDLAGAETGVDPGMVIPNRCAVGIPVP